MRARDGMSIFAEPEVLSLQEVESLRTGLECRDASLANQSSAEECDINVIVRRFGLTGQVPNQGIRLPTYQDFEDIFDFQTAMNAVRAAEQEFMKVPADIRSRFGNDPQQFVEFCSDEKNIDELRKLGLAKAKPADDAPKDA